LCGVSTLLQEFIGAINRISFLIDEKELLLQTDATFRDIHSGKP
jgi:hypothetical protein